MQIKNSKSYKHRSFVIGNSILEKLQKVAVSKDRSLNWLVCSILEEWVNKNA